MEINLYPVKLVDKALYHQRFPIIGIARLEQKAHFMTRITGDQVQFNHVEPPDGIAQFSHTLLFIVYLSHYK